MVVAAPADINAFLQGKAMHLVLMNDGTFTGMMAARGEFLQYTRIAGRAPPRSGRAAPVKCRLASADEICEEREEPW
jgi:hypothetical protein